MKKIYKNNKNKYIRIENSKRISHIAVGSNDITELQVVIVNSMRIVHMYIALYIFTMCLQ